MSGRYVMFFWFSAELGLEKPVLQVSPGQIAGKTRRSGLP